MQTPTAPAPQLPLHSRNKLDAMFTLDGCLNYQVECDPNEARAFFADCDTYNNHSNKDLVTFCDAVESILPRTFINDGNPNNGSHAYNWKIGNESSRVAYLNVKKWRIKGDMSKLMARIVRSAKNANADEVDVVSDTADSVTLRVWWD